MNNIAETISTWPIHDCWSISPGTKWCAQGNRIRLGANVQINGVVKFGDSVIIGNNVRIFDGTQLGFGVRIGDKTTIGNDVSIGDCAWIEERAQIEHDVWIGGNVQIQKNVHIKNNTLIEDNVHIGEGTRIGAHGAIESDAFIGKGSLIGPRCTRVLYLGRGPRDYPLLIVLQDGVPKFGAGCRWFTIEEARQHWGPTYTGDGDTAVMQAMITVGENIAKEWMKQGASG